MSSLRIALNVERMNATKLKEKFKEFRIREDEMIARQKMASTDTERFEWERLRRLHEIYFDTFLENEALREFLGQVEHQDSERQRAA